MRIVIIFILSLLIMAPTPISPIIKYSESKYKNVAANTTDTDGGVTVPNSEHVAVYRFRANGADPSAYVALIWDYGGGSEKIFASTKGDIDTYFDVSIHNNHLTGDGSKKLQIIIINDNSTQTPIIGGEFEVIEVND